MPGMTSRQFQARPTLIIIPDDQGFIDPVSSILGEVSIILEQSSHPVVTLSQSQYVIQAQVVLVQSTFFRDARGGIVGPV